MRIVTVLAVFALLSAPAQAGAPSGATGTWRLSNGKVTVKVAPCGAALCGRVVALKKPRDGQGRPRLDKENPNPALRQRPVMGLTILSDLRPSGEGLWSGTIYNPDDGYSYSSRLQLLSPTTMKVSGCFAGVLCKSMKFQRVE